MAAPEKAYFDAIREYLPYATAKDIAEEVGVTRQGADWRLRQLEEEGKVKSEMVGNTRVWRLGPVALDSV